MRMIRFVVATCLTVWVGYAAHAQQAAPQPPGGAGAQGGGRPGGPRGGGTPGQLIGGSGTVAMTPVDARGWGWQVTASVTTLLEKSTAALARAEEANRTLHGLGLQAVDAYTQRTPEAMRTRSEPFLALGAVKLEDEAENLRKALDAQRVVP